MKTLSITIIQSSLHWENIAKNLTMFSEKINAITTKTDIIVLPEMFNTGFSMQSEKLAETMSGKTITWMKKMAKRTNAVIVGSLIIKENSPSPSEGGEKEASLLEEKLRRVNYYNRLIWAEPNGKLFTYNKRHLFRMANEHKHFCAGDQRLIVNYKDWKICPLICYDLRFPAWARNITKNKTPAYDCAIYIANWPATRANHWSKLLEARAIENQCYIIGVNRVGTDKKNNTYTGNSAIIDAYGNKLSKTLPNQETIETVVLSMENLNAYRKKFPTFKDADNFDIY